MRLRLCVIILFGLSGFCRGQSEKSPKLHITKENLQVTRENLQASDGLLPKNDSISHDEAGEQQFINFNPVISFKDPKNILTIDKDLEDLSQVTIFTVYQSDNGSAVKGLWGIYSEESSITLTTEQIAISGKALSYEGGRINTPVLNTYVQAYGSGSIQSNPDNPQVIVGASSASEPDPFKGNIAEIMVFDNVLRAKERQVIETSLALKYGITLDNTRDYISSDEAAIYSVDENPGYTSRIFGIGRDDGAGLYQKQSHSTEESSVITIGLGKIAGSNLENSSELPDRNFLVLGDNNLDPDAFTTGKSNTSVPTMARQWKIQVTGDEASEIKTTLQLNISDSFKSLKMDESDFLMAVDRSGRGTFLPENTRYIEASGLEGNILSFESIQWDTDMSGSDVFTFALKKELEATLAEAESGNCTAAVKDKLYFDVKGGVPPYFYQLLVSDAIKDEWKSTDTKYPEKYIENLSPDIYLLKVTDGAGTQTEVQYNLKAPTPVSVNLGEDRQFQPDTKEILLDATVLSDEEISYEWSSDNGFSSDQPSITATLPGRYTVKVVSSNGCKASDSIEIEDYNVQSFSLFPNPSQDGNYKIHVELNEKQPIQVYVFDMTGKMLYSMSGKGQSTYSMPGNPINSSGIYNVVLQADESKVSRKLVVE